LTSSQRRAAGPPGPDRRRPRRLLDGELSDQTAGRMSLSSRPFGADCGVSMSWSSREDVHRLR
jgi:hypothetical protein